MAIQPPRNSAEYLAAFGAFFPVGISCPAYIGASAFRAYLPVYFTTGTSRRSSGKPDYQTYDHYYEKYYQSGHVRYNLLKITDAEIAI